ncbi:MAG: ABC transporter ATP-binding protein [Candidatus Methanoperedens sp.]
MSNTVIRVENLSKQYRLGTLNHGTLYRDLQSWWAQKRGREDPNSRIGTSNQSQSDNGNDTFWALKDVSFEVEKGEVVGIIGRNGAGKSTLLKILSRVTAPTTGEVKIKGRIASLLEVGTGFHPELTGRENIYLNGSILGMKKREIDAKFDEIVKFAEIEKFLDTPVKRYASGMYVRLAFAVAAHLEPEVLLVDEVLAVGDAAFQKKCLGKMGDVAREGRTVLFVSHNMTAVATLTQRCIELSRGVLKSGPTEQVIQHYLTGVNDQFGRDGCSDLTQADRPLEKVNPQTARAIFVRAYCLGADGKPRGVFIEGECLTILAQFQVRKPVEIMAIEAPIHTATDTRVFVMLSEVIHVSLQPGLYQMSIDLKPNYLRPGDYYVGLTIRTPYLQDGIERALQFTMEPSAEVQDNIDWSYPKLGFVRFPYRWTHPTAVSSYSNLSSI